MKCENSPQAKLKCYVDELIKDDRRWHDLYENGCFDPSYCDGVNLNLVRNHIIDDKKRIHNLVSEHPELSYSKVVDDVKIPFEVPNEYMAKPDLIIKNAVQKLADFEDDPNLKFLISVKPRLSGKAQEKTSIASVIGYYERLIRAIDENDLLTMRLYRNDYQSSFKECADKVRKYMSENKEDEGAFIQLSLF